MGLGVDSVEISDAVSANWLVRSVGWFLCFNSDPAFSSDGWNRTDEATGVFGYGVWFKAFGFVTGFDGLSFHLYQELYITHEVGRRYCLYR